MPGPYSCLTWIATAYHHRQVYIYDSLFTGSLTPSTEEQLVRLYRPAMRNNCQPAVRNNCLMVTAVSVQQQEGGVDCGLFNIAAAYHSAVSGDFRGLTFSQDDNTWWNALSASSFLHFRKPQVQ